MALHPSIMPRFRHPSGVLLAAPRAGFSAIGPRISPTRLPEEPELYNLKIIVAEKSGDYLA
jgi:hypothetical protein